LKRLGNGGIGGIVDDWSGLSCTCAFAWDVDDGIDISPATLAEADVDIGVVEVEEVKAEVGRVVVKLKEAEPEPAVVEGGRVDGVSSATNDDGVRGTDGTGGTDER
jgi:hypothetical protein